ncbi:DUF2304 domain-containing protein [Nocardioides sp.]|uniref:DUF2304 domain-containing protein n=1 Tax=Nocardioides sp. TaxID=35761 RepID=UPI0035684B86
MIIKVLLVVALAAAALVALRGRRTALNLLIRRALTLGVIAAGVFAVLMPDTVTEVANLLGVGRGADLVLYLLCVTFLFVSIGLYLRLSEMHDRYVELARKMALHEADALAHRQTHEDVR